MTPEPVSSQTLLQSIAVSVEAALLGAASTGAVAVSGGEAVAVEGELVAQPVASTPPPTTRA